MGGAVPRRPLYAIVAFRHTACRDRLRKQDRQTIPVLQMHVDYTHYGNEFANLLTSLTLAFDCRCKSAVAKFIGCVVIKCFSLFS